MKVGYSKSFTKAVKKLSGKMLDSVKGVIREVKDARSIKDDVVMFEYLVSRGQVYNKKVQKELRRRDS